MYSHFRTTWFDKVLAQVFNKVLFRRLPIPGNAPLVAGNTAPLEHEFVGRHLMANYVGCDPTALADHHRLLAALRDAIEASGATLLSELSYDFAPAGMTATMLLSESHASIHTYPEHGACFVDLFTCGRSCSAERFDAVLCEYLCPAKAHRRVVLRHARGTFDAWSAWSDASTADCASPIW
jgi:S-adenosylmethionine decarboxylase